MTERLRRYTGTGAALVVLLAGLLVFFSLAPAALAQTADPPVTEPPQLPHEPVVFPQRDFVSVEGYDPNTPVTIRVKRDGHTIGVADAVTDATGFTEVNHPGGVCWGAGAPPELNVTPDILPGDVVDVEIKGANGDVVAVDRQTTLGATAEPAKIVGNRLIVRGTAEDANGEPIPIERLEQRIVNPDFGDIEVGRRDIRATADGGRVPAGATATLAYDPVDPVRNPKGTEWTATYTGLSQQVMDLAVAGQTRVLAWQETTANGDRLGITIFEADEVGGPGFGGCPAGANYAVTESDPVSVNVAFESSGSGLVLSGVSHNASQVVVSLDDANNPDTAPVTETVTNLVPNPDQPGAQTWTATLDRGEVLGLDPETLTASARYTIPNPDTADPATVEIGGAKLKIVKDLVAPSAPESDLDTTPVYSTAQFVTLTNPSGSHDPEAKIHYTVNGSEPSASSRVFRNPIRVTTTQTIRAVAIDEAGNRSNVASFEYNFGGAAPPAPPPAPPLDPNDPPGVVNDPPQLPHEPVVFPSRDFVSAEGYEPGIDLEFRVLRNDVVVGRARGTTDATGFTEVNHPGGVCWAGVTPDIRAGDVLEVETPNGDVDRITTADISAEQAVIENGRVVVRGFARDGSGGPIPLANIEQRIINPDFANTNVGRRDIRATADGGRVPNGATATITYNDGDADPTTWTATYTGLSQQVMDLAVAGQTRVLAWKDTTAAGDRLGITIFEVGEVGGPGFGGCPNNRDFAVTGSSHYPAVNAFSQNENLVLYGTSRDASAVSLALTGAAGAIENIAVPAENISQPGGEQTWWVALSDAQMETLRGFADGEFTARATYTVPTDPNDPGSPVEQRSIGPALTITKDTEAPGAPTASPPPGQYGTAQSVTLDGPDPTAKIHYTLGDTAPGRATKGSLNPEPIEVDGEDQTIRAVAIDPAGNRSAVASFRYQIVDTTPPEAPTAFALAAESNSGDANDAITNDPTPTFTGNARAGARVNLFEVLPDNTLRPLGSATVGGNGSFSVTASEPLGDGAHRIVATVTSPAGNEGPRSSVLEITVDTTAPTVSANPRGGTYPRAQSVTLTGSEAGKVYFTRNGTPPNPGAVGTSEATGPVNVPATQTLRFIAVDVAGNRSAVGSERYVIRNALPTVTNISPTGTIRDRTPTIAATVNDADSDLAKANITLRVDGTVRPGFTYNRTTNRMTFTPTLGVGRHTVAVTVRDRDGGVTTRNWSFTIR
ncbi:Fn3 associated [Rubrobacter radiotolerans]|uniref:Chitobiase/beta-hexosaminidase C-terminal domain-containing protein n=1 Tax=Rubrobacter radiotolerans TaxID=42256 RepID=A0A023X3A2_RUBRA|nr:chitobiase/beta-hexosaminidase C-terminal domain-containing protein [Rubrobacter radiotolerans]AHY46490.1 Fn3 associated [Rubrobacter radiotolerans]MDX5893897.1 chitobiase/beta-hexosaminidase C-terminal domain-containing protein [Rubrobacter radiotolerans]SMC04719.1 Chitobiase/beta-hexosaminidase C-terminal domain-containing protein [Rubrobacter radiotolerans DSM 5868]